MKHPSVPGAKNWPERKKRAGLRVIDRGTDNDAEGSLVRLTRSFQKESRGKLVAFVGAFMYYDATTGERAVLNSAWGQIGLEVQIMLARKLQRYIEG
jgi:hypothetical protein